MVDNVRRLVLRCMRVPAEPHPPAGAPGSLRVFRAGKNFFKLKLVGWGIGQLVAFAGILFWVFVFFGLENMAIDVREGRRQAEPKAPAPESAPAPALASNPPARSDAPGSAPQTTKSSRKNSRPPRKSRSPQELFNDVKLALATQLARLPTWTFVVVWLLKIIGLLVYLVQLPITYAIARFDYEMRWYLVTDRSLRIRHGIWQLEESTMSFVNIQQVVVTQGPVQGLLGIADVRVQSAGGGSAEGRGKGGGDTLHTAVFHAVENANEIRDLILTRLRQFRAAGLGDPDDHHGTVAHATPRTVTAETLLAAKELLAETRAWRASI